MIGASGGLMFWYSGLSHCLDYWHPILEGQFKSWLLCFKYSFLLIHLLRQGRMA